MAISRSEKMCEMCGVVICRNPQEEALCDRCLEEFVEWLNQEDIKYQQYCQAEEEHYRQVYHASQQNDKPY